MHLLVLKQPEYAYDHFLMTSFDIRCKMVLHIFPLSIVEDQYLWILNEINQIRKLLHIYSQTCLLFCIICVAIFCIVWFVISMIVNLPIRTTYLKTCLNDARHRLRRNVELFATYWIPPFIQYTTWHVLQASNSTHRRHMTALIYVCASGQHIQYDMGQFGPLGE